MDRLTDDLKTRARELGFDLVGVAPAGSSRTSDVLDRWLTEGMHGDMSYMARTQAARSDPRKLLDSCRSVVVVAMSYRTGRPDSNAAFTDREPRVWVSRYAWGADYHRVLKKRLVRLGRWLASQRPGSGWRVCVDTAPILEREWAARAGLGWIGKNSSLLHQRLGSELFLGVLLTGLELRPDEPLTEHCGRCTACIDACPTGAIIDLRRIDARRCIAYLTVEHRSSIPAELQRDLGDMVAGCDVCQEVCPWTRRAPGDLHPEFLPAARRFRPRLGELLEMDEEAYRDWRAGSPLTRIPYRQFRRTLAVVRANLMMSGGDDDAS